MELGGDEGIDLYPLERFTENKLELNRLLDESCVLCLLERSEVLSYSVVY